MRGEGPPRGLVFAIDRCVGEDGPGIRTTVFLQGCPLHCLWCHSPQSQEIGRPQLVFYDSRCIGCGACVPICDSEAQVLSEGERRLLWDRCDHCGACADACPSGALESVGRWLTVDQVMEVVERDLPYYRSSSGGVTFSGGEPTAQADFLRACLERCAGSGIHTALDTCGFVKWELLAPALPSIDLILYDLKHMDSARHRELTGVGNELILENLRRVSRLGKPIWIRVPLVPGLNDSPQNLRRTATFVSKLEGVERLSLLPYNEAAGANYGFIGRDYELEDLRRPPEEREAEWLEPFAGLRLEVAVGGF